MFVVYLLINLDKILFNGSIMVMSILIKIERKLYNVIFFLYFIFVMIVLC